MRLVLSILSVAVLLSACAPTTRRMAGPQPIAGPSAETYVWARNDGRRMSENPALLRQGQIDQAACRQSASGGGTLNLPAFTSCMEARGYSRRRA